MDHTLDLFTFATPEAIALCTSSRETWWRWKTGRVRAPRAVLNLLRIVVHGELPQGGSDWEGWRFIQGSLFDPAGYAHTPATIGAWFWTAQELQELRRRENMAARELPAGVVQLPSSRRAHAITDELGKRLEAQR